MTKKRRNIVEWAMHYRQIVIMVACCLVAFGVYGLADMNKNEFPDFTVRQGVVVAVYPGVSAQDVEEQLTKPLENYIFSYKEIKKEKTKSYSRNGMAIIQIELNDDVSGTDKDNFWSKFKHGINTFKAQLPSGVLALMVQDDFGDIRVGCARCALFRPDSPTKGCRGDFPSGRRLPGSMRCAGFASKPVRRSATRRDACLRIFWIEVSLHSANC